MNIIKYKIYFLLIGIIAVLVIVIFLVLNSVRSNPDEIELDANVPGDSVEKEEEIRVADTQSNDNLDRSRDDSSIRDVFNPNRERDSTVGLTAEEVELYILDSDMGNDRVIWDELYQLFGEEEYAMTHKLNLKEDGEGRFRGVVHVWRRGPDGKSEEEGGLGIIFDIIVNQDFSIKILEDTIELDSIKLASGTEGEFGYFFIKPTTNTFLENGYQIKEYQYIQLDEKADSNIVINMPQIRGENGYYYGKINYQLRSEIKGYFENIGMEGVHAQVDYEIKRLDENIISVAYFISYTQGAPVGKLSNQTVFGVNICMKTDEKLLLNTLCPSTTFDTKGVNTFYLANDMIHISNNEAEGTQEQIILMKKFVPWHYEMLNKEIIDEAGNLIGKVYCQIPQIEGNTREIELVNDLIFKKCGVFFENKDEEFDKNYLIGSHNYSYDEYANIILGESPIERRLDCSIICNRDGYISIKTVDQYNGESGFNYDLNMGKQIELTDLSNLTAIELNAIIKQKVIEDMQAKEESWMSDENREIIEIRDPEYMEEAYAKVENAKIVDWDFYFTCDQIFICYNKIINFEHMNWQEERMNLITLDNKLFSY